MRIEIDVPVVITGRMKTTHSIKWVFAAVPQVFEIPEHSLYEAPQVLSLIERYDGDKTRRLSYHGFEGRLLTDRTFLMGDRAGRAFHFDRWDRWPVHPFFAAAHEDVVNRVQYIQKESFALAQQKIIPDTFYPQYDNRIGNEPFRFATLGELGIRHFDDGAVERQLADFAKRMERMVFLDGRVFAAEQEPVIEIGGWSNFFPEVQANVRDRPEPTPLIPVSFGRYNRPYEYLSLSDHERLAERMEAVASRFNTRKIGGRGLLEVRIDDPRYLALSAEALSLRAVADMMRQEFLYSLKIVCNNDEEAMAKSQALMMELDPAVLALGQRLISGLETSEEGEVSHDLEEAVADIIDYAGAQPKSGRFGNAALTGHASDILTGWYDRAVSVEFSQPRRLTA